MINEKQIQKYEQDYDRLKKVYDQEKQRYQQMGAKQGNFIEDTLKGAEQCSVAMDYIKDNMGEIEEALSFLGHGYVELKIETEEARELGALFLRYGKKLEQEFKDMLNHYRTDDASEESEKELEQDSEDVLTLEGKITDSRELFDRIALRRRVGTLIEKYKSIMTIFD